VVLILALVGLLLPACVEEKTEIELQPDLSGKLRFEQVLGQDLSSLLLDLTEGEDLDSQLEESCAEALAAWEGIAAWTDIRAGTVDRKGKKRVRYAAVGWFPNLSRVRRSGEGDSSIEFVVKREGENVTIFVKEEAFAEDDDEESSFFDQAPEDLPRTFEMTKGMIGELMEELRQEVTLLLPADPGALKRFVKSADDPRRVTAVTDVKVAERMLDSMFAKVQELAPKVRAGEMTKEAAQAKVNEHLAEEWGLVATFPASDAGASEEFRKAYEAAVDTWGGSRFKEMVEEAR
jgi:hypothetical protein